VALGAAGAAEAMTGAGVFRRLSSFDLMFLRFETPEWPCHFGGLTVLEGGALLDEHGRLRMQEIIDRLERRLQLVPQLRRRLHVPGPFGGRPLWVDDPRFAIGRHVHQIAVPEPGGDDELLQTVARVYMIPLDRRRPLWQLWFFTGLDAGRVAAMLKLHHSIADGMAAVTIMGSLFDLEPGAPDPPAARWVPERIPSQRALRAENLEAKIEAVRRFLADVARPGARSRMLASIGRASRIARSYAGANPELRAPSTSLNRVVGAGRRIGVVRLDLAAAKDAAHAHDAKINDVVLDLWSGGLRRLLASRGESTDLELVTSVPVSLRAGAEPGTVDNRTGWVAFALPTSEPDPRRRLDEIAGRTRRVKASQPPAAIAGFMAALAATPLARMFTMHQRTGNVIVTNVPGPPVPMYMFGARVREILPIVELVGNVGLVLCAFSYADWLSLVVTADATAFSDLDVLMEGMEQDWAALTGATTARSAPGPRVPG
jgi:WS/DGAT/MGAT family acyltransferase